jgi:DNA polymerase
MVPGEGPLPALGLVIGEAPGKVETELGRPFVGPSGQLLDHALKLLGIDRSELYITNVVKVMPTDEIGAIRRPNEDEIAQWRPLLNTELEACSPAAILLLGKTAAESYGYSPELVEQHIYAAWHPSYVLRNRNEEMWQKWLFQLSPFVHEVRAAEALQA